MWKSNPRDSTRVINHSTTDAPYLTYIIIISAIKNYLNEGAGGLCRSLIMQFLTELWKIHSWARKQTSVRLFSSSLLLVYDANSLRACCGDTYDHT